MLFFLIGAVALFGVSILAAYGVGKWIAFGNDHDAPAHVCRNDWERISRRRV